MKLSPLKSSNVKAAGYDESEKRLRIQFTTGAIYDYSNVPKKVYDKLLAAPSKGSFMSTHVKGVYEFERVK